MGIYLGDRVLDEEPEANQHIHEQVDSAFETVSKLRELVLTNMRAIDIVDALELYCTPETCNEVRDQLNSRA